MEVHTEHGQGAYALTINTIIQAQSRQGYHISGGGVSPGTSSTSITVDVAPGSVHINERTVDFAGGGPSLPDADNKPRVDVISVTQAGEFSITRGTPHEFAPTEDENGNPISDHIPFHHWEPAPNDGGGVTGVPLGLVLVRPDTADATDLSNADVNDEILRISASESEQYIRGDGTDNGRTIISVNDADFAVQDETDAKTRYLWRDHSEGKLFVGTPNAEPTLRTSLDANDYAIKDVGGIKFRDDDVQNIDINTSAGGFAIRDRGGGAGADDIFSIAANEITASRQLDMQGRGLFNVKTIGIEPDGAPVLDLEDDPDGSQVLWQHTDGEETTPTKFYAQSNLAGGSALSIVNNTDNQVLFRQKTSGNLEIPFGDVIAGGSRLLSKSEADSTYFSDSGGTVSGPVRVENELQSDQWIGLGVDAADPPAPPEGYVRIYANPGGIEAKNDQGNIANIATF